MDQCRCLVYSLDNVYSLSTNVIVTSRLAGKGIVHIELLDLGGKSVGTYLLYFKAGTYVRISRFTFTK